MSRIVAIEYVSLHGVTQGPEHAGEDPDEGFEHGGWTGPFMAEDGRYLSGVFTSAGDFLLGRVTYDNVSLARHLAGRFTVVSYDDRGRGQSDSGDTPPHAAQREIEDIEAVIDAARGHAYLYGISSGAVLALEAGLRADRHATLGSCRCSHTRTTPPRHAQ